MSEKIYIVTDGCYSDYHIEACFTTKEKAKEYIKNGKISKQFWEDPNIEEWIIDDNIDIVNVIDIFLTITSPFSKREHNEEIKTRVEQEIRSKVYTYSEKADLYGSDYETLHIREIANPNKTIEEETERLKKVAYDTAKRINYLYKVEDITDAGKMRKILNQG